MSDKNPQCPLPKAHNRLGQAHWLWHESLAAYPDPRRFQSRVNSLIQEVRNITFILQYEKRQIPGFDEWYERWRYEMQQDAMMRWLVETRNRVVKQGDLETKSTALVKVLASYLEESPVKELELPAHFGPRAVAAHVKVSGLPADLQDDAVVLVERRWVTATLPDWELLDGIGYCYKRISALVAEGHERAGVPMLSDLMEVRSASGHPVGAFIPGRQECMSTTPEMRTAALKLSTGEFIESQHSLIEPGDMNETKAIAANRYGIDQLGYDPIPTADNLTEVAGMFLERAKKVLASDRHHVSMLFLFPPNGPPLMRGIIVHDRSEKYVYWQRIAEEVRRLGIEALLTINEIWQGKQGEFRPGMRGVEDIPTRTEGLQVTAADSSGKVHVLTAPFSRGKDGEIIFGETQVATEKDIRPQFLKGVFDVWDSRRGTHAAPTQPD